MANPKNEIGSRIIFFYNGGETTKKSTNYSNGGLCFFFIQVLFHSKDGLKLQFDFRQNALGNLILAWKLRRAWHLRDPLGLSAFVAAPI